MKTSFIPILGLLAAANSASAVTVLLNDQFTDGERLTQDLTTSAQWTVGAQRGSNPIGTGNVVSGSLVVGHKSINNDKSFVATWAHFTASGSPRTIAVGETLNLTFTLALTGTGDFSGSESAFRFGLFNSGGSRVTTDFVSTGTPGIESGTTFTGWRGYSAETPANNALNGQEFRIRERNVNTPGPGLFSGGNYNTVLNTNQGTENIFAANTPYNALLSLERTLTGIRINSTIGTSSTIQQTDTVDPFVAFDTVAFFAVEGLSYDLTFDDVKVELIPEPSGAVLAVLSIGMFLFRRRRA